jgi:hypothetical protein
MIDLKSKDLCKGISVFDMNQRIWTTKPEPSVWGQIPNLWQILEDIIADWRKAVSKYYIPKEVNDLDKVYLVDKAKVDPATGATKSNSYRTIKSIPEMNQLCTDYLNRYNKICSEYLSKIREALPKTINNVTYTAITRNK